MSRGYEAHHAIDELEGEIEYLEKENERLTEELGNITSIGYNTVTLRDMIKNLYIAKTSASDREFDMQLRDMFMKVLDKRL